MKLKLICGNANRPLAAKIAEALNRPLSAAEVSRFSDGEVFVQINENVRGTDLFIIQPTNPPAENLMELLMLLEAARHASAKRITAVIPYYGYGRADRKAQPRVPITARLVAHLIQAAGADRVLTMDLHASQIQGFFDIPSDHLYSSIIFNEFIRRQGIDNNAVVVAPDLGSIKMVRAFARVLDCGIAIIDKRRPEPNASEILTIIGEVEGKTVLLRDDMIDTGGTLTQAAWAVRERGAGRVLACCTHAVLSGRAVERIEESPIEKLYISDTIDTSDRKLPEKIETIDCSNVLAQAIRRIAAERSISELFEGI